MAQTLEVSERTVQRGLRALEAAELVRRIERGRDWMTDIYIPAMEAASQSDTQRTHSAAGTGRSARGMACPSPENSTPVQLEQPCEKAECHPPKHGSHDHDISHEKTKRGGKPKRQLDRRTLEIRIERAERKAERVRETNPRQAWAILKVAKQYRRELAAAEKIPAINNPQRATAGRAAAPGLQSSAST